LDPILEVRNLTKHFPVTGGTVFSRPVAHIRAVDGVSFQINRGETLGLVGESGCGKSTTGRMIMRLLEPTSGSILFEGTDTKELSHKDLRQLRRQIQIVFQDPFASLSPRMRVENILAEPFHIHGLHEGRKTRSQIVDLLDAVGMSSRHLKRYPHEFSGGQRQRIGIARALALNPSLLILDEPVSALDVSIQAQILNLLESLQNAFNLTYLLIAHDLAVVRHAANRVAVMYLGKIVETTERQALYERPVHPYTQALLSAVPIPDPAKERMRTRILLSGDPPSPRNPPPACRFNPRCWKAKDICRETEPVLEQTSITELGHHAACHFPEVAYGVQAGTSGTENTSTTKPSS
jgi:peptide/nickel transport system ATP-binding protein/oligopeptide transport system ATP-binding protein